MVMRRKRRSLAQAIDKASTNSLIGMDGGMKLANSVGVLEDDRTHCKEVVNGASA